MADRRHPSVVAVQAGVRRVLAALEPGSTVGVACSGGADSLALLAAAVAEAPGAGVARVVGVTVDHGLQPGSSAHAARVADQMRELGAAESVVATVTVSAEGLGPEAAAREARYEVLTELAERLGASVVLLGHTLDDQAETVLMGLARGSGGRSLAGMRRGFGVFRRPLLDVTRDDTETACLTQGIEWWTDPHNVDDRFTRVRVRSTVLPLLEDELGPGVARALARTADALREDTTYLDAVADAALASVATADSEGAGLEVEPLAALDPAVRRRVLRLATVTAGAIDAELYRDHVLAMDRLLTDWHGQTGIDLPGHLRAVRRAGLLRFDHR